MKVALIPLSSSNVPMRTAISDLVQPARLSVREKMIWTATSVESRATRP